MKKGIISLFLLTLSLTSAMAQTVVCSGSGDVTIKQGEPMEFKCEGAPIVFKGEKIVLTSYKDYDITLPTLQKILVTGTGDLSSKEVLRFPNLDIVLSGTGDADLNVECDTITTVISGIGDLKLKGHCGYLQATISGIGDLHIKDLTVDSLSVVKGKGNDFDWNWEWKTIRKKDEGEEKKNEPKKYSSLWFNPKWSGFEAGLNMLLGPGGNGDFTGQYALLSQKPMSSWNFNFNIADVGLAFSYTHRVGIYTGIGLGWNNFSFNQPVRLEKGPDGLICHHIDETVTSPVKLSKLGVLYLQMPLMVQVKPTRRSYLALGVTGGFRIDTWTKVKFANGVVDKVHNDYYINRFKLDASLRAGGSFLGFFANFNLLPFFEEDKAQTAHSLSFGLSLNF